MLFRSSDVSIKDSIDTGDGEYKFYSEIMKDHKPGGYGKITIKEVFEKSSNIGIAKLIDEQFEPGFKTWKLLVGEFTIISTVLVDKVHLLDASYVGKAEDKKFKDEDFVALGKRTILKVDSNSPWSKARISPEIFKGIINPNNEASGYSDEGSNQSASSGNNTVHNNNNNIYYLLHT